MRILLALTILIAFSASAYAESNTITVVNEDGTKTSIDIGPSPVAPPVESVVKSAPPARMVDADTPAPVKPAKKPAAKPAKKPAPQKQAVKKAPEKKASVKKEAAVKKKKTAKPADKKAAQKAQKKQTPAKPVAATDKAPKAPSAAPSQQRLGPHMTPDDAIRIALDAAPPARSVHAYAVNYKGLHAYQVIFATEEGDRSVFVDRETAKIIR